MQTSTSRNQQQIACVAYGLWEKAGRPAGRDQEFWFKAEQQIESASQPRTHATAPAPQRPKDSPTPAAAATAPATTTTEFEWKTRSQIQNGGEPGNGPTARPISTRGRRGAPTRPARAG